MNKPSDTIPKDMPRQYRFTTASMQTVLFDIKSWRFNEANGPKESDFPPPSERPGWQVIRFDAEAP